MEMTRRKLLLGDRYLSFQLMNEVYCIDIKRVKELMGMADITPIPQVPAFIKGVINLRGQIIPIIDLRLKFGMSFKEYSKRTSVIIVELTKNTETILVGVAVDTIDEVISIPADKISHLSYVSANIRTDFITGVVHLDDGMKIVLDIVKVLNDDELGTLKNIESGATNASELQEAIQ